MMNFISDLSIQPVVDFFNIHPHSALIVTYFTTFLESMAIVGMFVPGSIIMPAIGFLIGSGVIPADSTFLCAIIGAITGDYLSYLIGVHYKARIHLIWPFTRWPYLLNSGEKYFRAHGGKSIFIGRFVGPTRAIIPMIAGMLKMSSSRFLFASIPSASVWAACYIVPGILLGALSLELPPKVAAEFTLWALLVLVVLWAIVWLIKHSFKQVCQLIDSFVRLVWSYCRKHKNFSWVIETFTDSKDSNNYQQLMLAIMAVLGYVLFFLITHQVIINGIFTNLDQPVYYLLRSLRTDGVDRFVVLITLLGDSTVLAISSGIFLLWLLQRRYFYTAMHWFVIMVLSISTVIVAKTVVYSPRPMEVLYEKYVSSFPSAHTTLSLVFYGFLAVIVAHGIKNKKLRGVPYILSGVLVALIAFSRLYLSVHWLSDVLGSIFIGLAIILSITICYRRNHINHQVPLFSVHKTIVAVICIFIVTWLSCSMFIFPKQLKEYALVWPQQQIFFDKELIAHTAMPLFRLNRLGHPIEALNIRLIGNSEVIKKILSDQGWEIQAVNFNFRSLFMDLRYHISIFPQLYHNKLPIMVLTKKNGKDILLLRLWESDISLSNVDSKLFIGSVYSYHQDSNNFSLNHFGDGPSFVDATEIFINYLSKFEWKQKTYLKTQQPPEMAKLNWNGKLLFIYPQKATYKEVH